MKVLFVSSWFPCPADNGSRIRAYNLLKALAVDHDVILISLMQSDSCTDNAVALQDVCDVWSLHESRWFKPGTLKSTVGYLSPKPRSIVDTFNAQVRDSISRAVEYTRPAVLVASQLAAMVHVPRNVDVPVVFEEVEVGSLEKSAAAARGVESVPKQLTLTKHRWLVSDLLNRSECYTCVSSDELKMCSEYAPRASGHVVPNGVDIDWHTPAARSGGPGNLIYTGALSYDANLDAVRFYCSQIYPVLRRAMPDIKLLVTGRTDGVDLAGISDCPGIELTGYLDDIRTVLAKSSACVVPLRQGGGSRLKILEAMAAGVPVVSTSIGAEGIDCVNGQHLLLADDPAEFAAAVKDVMTKPQIGAALAKEARALVEDKHSWKNIGVSFSRLVADSAVAGRASCAR